MSTETTTTILKIQDQFSQPLQRLDSALHRSVGAAKDFSQATSSMGSGLKQGAADMFHMINAAQQYYQVMSGVFRTANEWAQQGIAAERNKIALQSLTGAGKEYQDQIHGIIDATRGLVTAGEAAGYAYRLQRFGLADTAAEMEKFMRTVSIVAAVNPQLGGTAEAINQIQLTLSNMSFMRLDQLGVSAGKVRERMAELKAATKDMSDEQAFSAAVMEQLNEQADAVGDSILGMNDATERMKTHWREFKEDWGLKIATGLESVVSGVEGVTGAMNENITATAVMKEAWRQLVEQPIESALGINQIIPGSEMPNVTPWMQAPEPGVHYGQGGPPMPAQIITHNGTEFYIQGDLLNQTLGGAGPIQYPSDVFGTPPGLANQPGFGYNVDPAAVRRVAQAQYDAYYARQAEAGIAPRWSPNAMTGGQGPDLTAFNIGQNLTFGMQGAWNQYQQQSIPNMDYGAYYSRQRQTREGGAFDPALADSSKQMEILNGAIQKGVGAFRQLLNSSQEFVVVIQSASDKWDSLNDKFGIEPKAFDSDMFNAAAKSLQDVWLWTSVEEDAMTGLGLAFGTTSVSNELFKTQMDLLAEQFANADINLEEYLLQVQKLGEQDFTWIDKLAEGLSAYDKLQLEKQAVAYQTTYGESPVDTFTRLKDQLLGPGEGGAGETVTAGDAYTTITQHVGEAQSAIDLFASNGVEAMSNFSVEAVSDAEKFGDALDRLHNRSIHVTAYVDIQTTIQDLVGSTAPSPPTAPTAPSPAWGVPGRAGGGDVRGGGLYRVTEGQIPELFEGPGGQQYLMAPRGGGRVIAPQFAPSGGAGSGDIQIVVPLYMDKESVGKAVAEVNRTRGAKTR